jgi:hypothetical protein
MDTSEREIAFLDVIRYRKMSVSKEIDMGPIVDLITILEKVRNPDITITYKGNQVKDEKYDEEMSQGNL